MSKKLKKIQPPSKFIIFAQGRTGSSLLRNLLNSHPGVHCDKELLGRRRLIFVKSFLTFRRLFFKKCAYGFKVKIYQLTDVQKIRNPRQIMIDLHKKGWNIIYLRRKNLLHHAVSNIVAKHRKKENPSGKAYAHRIEDGPIELKKIHVNCDELIQRMRAREIFCAQENLILDGLPHMRFVYEDHLLKSEDHQSTASRIFDHLGLPVSPVAARLVKIVPERLADIIDNFDEIVKTINKTKYAKFL